MSSEFILQTAADTANVAGFALGPQSYAPTQDDDIREMQILVYSSSTEFKQACKQALNALSIKNVSFSNDVSVLKSACKDNVLDLLIYQASSDSVELLSELSANEESQYSYLLHIDNPRKANETLIHDERFAGMVPQLSLIHI